jgi:chemotaxis protein MotB
MARMHHWIGFVALSFSLVGCVSQEKYNAVKLANDDLTTRLAASESEANLERAQASNFKQQLDALSSNGNNAMALVTNRDQTIAELTAQNQELTRRLTDALNRPVTVEGALPQNLTNALTEFAQANPGIVDFDSARGIVKFKSDVTFATGSAEVTPQARDAVARFATILNSQAASGYELMVAGHTDNVRVSNPATIKAGNKDNWYLSAHRAISVASVLMGDGIAPGRLAVAGYADNRPAASNSSESGRAQNRRVEVLILPTTARSIATGSSPRPTQRTGTASARPPVRSANPLNKDATSGTNSESAPMPLNK